MSLAHRMMALSALGALAGCSLVYSSDIDKNQCETNEDCGTASNGIPYVCANNICTENAGGCVVDTDCRTASGAPDTTQRCGFDSKCYSKWDCLNAPNDFMVTTTPFHIKTSLVNILDPTNPNLGNFSLVGCLAEDPTCANPSIPASKTTLSQVEVTPNNYQLQADITFDSVRPTGFNGVFKILPPPGTDFAVAYMHAGSKSPWVGDYTTFRPTFIGSPATIALVGSTGITPFDPAKAIGGISVFDCGGRPAPNVTIEVVRDQSTDINATAKFYPVDSTNVPQVIVGQALLPTNSEGRGFVVNLELSRLTQFKLTEANPDGTPIMVIEPGFSIFVQSGGFNYVNYYPRYSAVQAYMRSSEVPGKSVAP